MKIVSISNSPTVCDNDGFIKGTVTDLNKILDYIDPIEGRNDAIRTYIYALRDLQRAIDLSGICHEDGRPKTNLADIDAARAAVAAAFDRLIVAEFSLNRPRDHSNEWRDV
jgi:hypothetical protein